MTYETTLVRAAETTPHHIVLKMLIASMTLTVIALTLAAVFH